jgi:hypothetical protein
MSLGHPTGTAWSFVPVGWRRNFCPSKLPWMGRCWSREPLHASPAAHARCEYHP